MERRPAAVVCTLLLALTACLARASGQECDSEHFRCRNGHCIPKAWRCDGTKDCLDDSDEIGCAPVTCQQGYFKCQSDGQCIPNSWVCDQDQDCDDGSDELQHCSQSTCSSHQITCSNGQCIPGEYRCDHVRDCPDGADEKDCQYPTCEQLTCDNGACYNNSQKCDSKVDCRDHSDELNCTEICFHNEFSCGSGECIPRTYVCDHDNDCQDGSDEHACNYPTCRGYQFTCPNGRCIYQNWVCDGEDDCKDNGDEDGCESSPHGVDKCSPREWSCPESGRCISIYKVCDGVLDCPGREDENSTTTGKYCGTTLCSALNCQYQCHETPYGGVCFCPPGYTINHNDSRTCVEFDDCQIWGICDQRCESRPGHHLCHCEEGYILEHGQHCKANDSFGEASVIFSNGRDLLIGDIHGRNFRILVESQNRGVAVGVAFHYHLQRVFWTDTVQNKVFSVHINDLNIQEVLNISVETPENLAVDWVNNKLYLVETKVNRIDMVNLDGSYRVTLITENLGHPRGIAVDPTVGKTVVHGGSLIPHPFGVSLFEGQVFFTDWTKMAVLKANKFTETNPQVYYQTSLRPYGVTVYHPLRQPYATNPCKDNNGGCEQVCVLSHRTDNDGLGFRCKCTFGFQLDTDERHCIGREILAANRVENVESLAFDWISKNLYWTDSHYKSISVMGLADKMRRTVVQYLNNPRSVVIHPLAGYLFFTDWFRPAKIMRAWSDGSHLLPIVNTTLGWPNGLAIDWAASRLYWVDAYFDKIEHSTFDGLDRRRLGHIEQMSHPFGLTMFGEHLFFTDWRLGAIIRVRKADGGGMTVIRSGISYILHLKSYDINIQTGSNACSQPTHPNGDCSHFCFPVPNFQRVCGCPYGMRLASNHLTCEGDPSNEPPTEQCGLFSFPCQNGRCVPQYYRCDGVDDCHDNSDEQLCGTLNNTCSPSAFTCGHGECIPERWHCDKHNDCVDGSDEQNCPTQAPVSCLDTQYTCDNHQCISKNWVCDTDNDCGDGSDEKNCNSTETCQPSQFNCPNHRCIDLSFVCDGDRDCVDGSDEVGCVLNCTASQFKCASGDKCISITKHCDGVFDCNDNSDEAGCPTRPPGMCHSDEFQCQEDGDCIPKIWECDGHPDCLYGSDEHNACVPKTCSSSYFLCDNGNCIHRVWLCDQDNDCGDMSDEKDCPTQPFHCPSWQWQCLGHNICVNLSVVCDGTFDCPNGTDESPLCSKFPDHSLLTINSF
uniref:LDL receptor related protein 2 n=1 Tax=Cebus imitator TaxID=2715852 RepID=A0A2K5RWI9_CEBIM